MWNLGQFATIDPKTVDVIGIIVRDINSVFLMIRI